MPFLDRESELHASLSALHPENLGEVRDQIGSMVLGAPEFTDDEFPGRNIDTEFFELLEGLQVVRAKIGEERYRKLVDMAERTKAIFAGCKFEDAEQMTAGLNLLLDMLEVLKRR